MAITNVGFDGTVSEAQWSKMMRRVAADGIGQLLWSGGDVTAPGTGRTVSVAAYDAWIAGVWSVGDAATTVTLSANTSGKPRIDYVILDVDWIANTVAVTKVDGSPANNPVAPNLTQTAGVRWQMPLARVTVANGVSNILGGDIEPCAPQPRQVIAYTATVSPDSIQGSATNWNTIGGINITDPGWPYRMVVSASVRVNATESGGYMRVRVNDLTAGFVVATGVTSELKGKKAPAVIASQVSAVRTGPRRVILEMLPAEMAGGEVSQVLDADSNNFTVLLLPA